jgi:hypothetical protein
VAAPLWSFFIKILRSKNSPRNNPKHQNFFRWIGLRHISSKRTATRTRRSLSRGRKAPVPYSQEAPSFRRGQFPTGAWLSVCLHCFQMLCGSLESEHLLDAVEREHHCGPTESASPQTPQSSPGARPFSISSLRSEMGDGPLGKERTPLLLNDFDKTWFSRRPVRNILPIDRGRDGHDVGGYSDTPDCPKRGLPCIPIHDL